MPYTDSTNYYGSLCTEMYELLHGPAGRGGAGPLSLLCPAGDEDPGAAVRQRTDADPLSAPGIRYHGMDLSAEMLDRLRQKWPMGSRGDPGNLIGYRTDERYDYIFIPSGSIVLFTDLTLCREILTALRGMLREDGVLVFSVDTVASRSPDDAEYREDIPGTDPRRG